MKKLKLKALEFGASELLTREQLKNIMGAGGSLGPITTCKPTGYSCIDPGPPCCGYCEGMGVCRNY